MARAVCDSGGRNRILLAHISLNQKTGRLGLEKRLGYNPPGPSPSDPLLQ